MNASSHWRSCKAAGSSKLMHDSYYKVEHSPTLELRHMVHCCCSNHFSSTDTHCGHQIPDRSIIHLHICECICKRTPSAMIKFIPPKTIKLSLPPEIAVSTVSSFSNWQANHFHGYVLILSSKPYSDGTVDLRKTAYPRYFLFHLNGRTVNRGTGFHDPLVTTISTDTQFFLNPQFHWSMHCTQPWRCYPC